MQDPLDEPLKEPSTQEVHENIRTTVIEQLALGEEKPSIFIDTIEIFGSRYKSYIFQIVINHAGKQDKIRFKSYRYLMIGLLVFSGLISIYLFSNNVNQSPKTNNDLLILAQIGISFFLIKQVFHFKRDAFTIVEILNALKIGLMLFSIQNAVNPVIIYLYLPVLLAIHFLSRIIIPMVVHER